MTNTRKDQPKKPTILQVIVSVLAAMFGVQSDANRERDFENGSFAAYIITGIVLTVLFVLSIYFVVQLVI